MEFYNDSPATKFFTDEAIVLSGSREQDEITREWTFTERILYINYMFEDKSISFAIFDNVTSKYVLDMLYIKSFAEAEEILNEIAAEYPGKIDTKVFLSQWKIFFAAMVDAVWVESNITDVDGSCGQCEDYNKDEFIFLYVPAVPGTKLSNASLGVHWDYGCYGGKKISGTYEDVVAEVTDLLLNMENVVLDDYKPKVEKALATLAKVS